MRKSLLVVVLFVLAAPAAWASGCYTCGNGSAPACRDYCEYKGADTFDNRHKCVAKGCKIAGTSACPDAAAKARMCLDERPAPRPDPDRRADNAAAIPWCAPVG
jgi:hypothetical protein